MRELVRLLELHGLHPMPWDFSTFLQAGIELRESSKFHFTRNLSDALALMSEYGAQLGLSREDLAYCDIAAFKELHVAAGDPKDLLSRSIEYGKARYEETQKVSLPPLIVRPEDVWGFEWPETAPNFITQKAGDWPGGGYRSPRATRGRHHLHSQCRSGFRLVVRLSVAGAHHRLGWRQFAHGDPCRRIGAPGGDWRWRGAISPLVSRSAPASGLCGTTSGDIVVKLVAVSQRVDVYLDRNERRDALDQRLGAFLLVAGFLPVPIPNIFTWAAGEGALMQGSFNAWLETIGPQALVLSGGNDIGTCGKEI